MSKISPFMVLPPLLFCMVVGVFLFGILRENPDDMPSARAGKIAPDMTSLTTLETRGKFDDELLRGDGIKIVNFWASWCAPCRAEHPQLKALSEYDLQLIGINYKDNPSDANRFLDELGDPFVAIGSDQNGRAALDWGLFGVPETYIIDGEGEITFRFAGPITKRVLEETILPEIEKARSQ